MCCLKPVLCALNCFMALKLGDGERRPCNQLFTLLAPIAFLFFVCLVVLQPLEIPCHVFAEKVLELIYVCLLVAPLQHLQRRSLVYIMSIVDGSSCKMMVIILDNLNLFRHFFFFCFYTRYIYSSSVKK